MVVRNDIDPFIAWSLIGACLLPLTLISVPLLVGWSISNETAPLAEAAVAFVCGLVAVFAIAIIRGGGVHYAARSGQSERIAALHEAGYSVSRRNALGQSPLDLAIQYRHLRCAAVLIVAEFGHGGRDSAFLRRLVGHALSSSELQQLNSLVLEAAQIDERIVS